MGLLLLRLRLLMVTLSWRLVESLSRVLVVALGWILVESPSLQTLLLVLSSLPFGVEIWVHHLNIAGFVPHVQKLDTSAGYHPILLLLQASLCQESLDLWIG